MEQVPAYICRLITSHLFIIELPICPVTSLSHTGGQRYEIKSRLPPARSNSSRSLELLFYQAACTSFEVARDHCFKGFGHVY